MRHRAWTQTHNINSVHTQFHIREALSLVWTYEPEELVPIVVVDGTVLVATMGATVAAATGVTGLKMGFWG